MTYDRADLRFAGRMGVVLGALVQSWFDAPPLAWVFAGVVIAGLYIRHRVRRPATEETERP